MNPEDIGYAFIFALCVYVLGRNVVDLLMGGNKDETPEPVEKKKKHEFMFRDSKYIVKVYERLDKDFQQFPELYDALTTLETKANIEHGITGSGNLRHRTNCVNYTGPMMSLSNVKHDCDICRPFKELEAAVYELKSAQDERRFEIEKAEQERALADVEATMVQYAGLAERMRTEAGIHRQVTDEVFRELA